jgi:hypothetical protein
MYGVDLRIQEDLCSDIFERFFFPLLMFVARCFSARFHGLGLFSCIWGTFVQFFIYCFVAFYEVNRADMMRYDGNWRFYEKFHGLGLFSCIWVTIVHFFVYCFVAFCEVNRADMM